MRPQRLTLRRWGEHKGFSSSRIPVAVIFLARFVLIVLLTTALVPSGRVLAKTGPSGLPLPRFVSINSDRVNVRKGPGQQYPIVWVYRRKGMPVEIVAEYEQWRQIRDRDSGLGWVQKNLLSGRRTALVTGAVRSLRKDPRDDASPVALLEPGVIGEIKRCKGEWCEVKIRNYSGWMRRNDLWGVYPEEILE